MTTKLAMASSVPKKTGAANTKGGAKATTPVPHKGHHPSVNAEFDGVRKLLNGKNKRMEEQGASEFVDVVVHPGDLFVNRTHSTATFVYQACDKILPNNSLRHRMARFRLPGELVWGAAAPTILKEMNWDRKRKNCALRTKNAAGRRTNTICSFGGSSPAEFVANVLADRFVCTSVCQTWRTFASANLGKSIGWRLMAKKIHLMYADKPVSALEEEFNAAVKLYGQPVPALDAHKNGRSTPIEPRLDFSAQSNADDHPGLGYKCGRWQVEGMVRIHPFSDANGRTAISFGAKTNSQHCHLCLQAGDKILQNNSLRHRMARFLLPGELVWGAAAPTISQARKDHMSRTQLFEKHRNRLDKKIGELKAVVDGFTDQWPDRAGYQRVALLYNTAIGWGQQMEYEAWPPPDTLQEEMTADNERICSMNKWKN
ncbi:hypothetical protein niasHT_019857 [Heterodera trifolii]|uniref:Fido domain-containing protein n=1 Tax=Heterodera trifolii TaxID=157864 RepID=A0ABD2KV87_9BILA